MIHYYIDYTLKKLLLSQQLFNLHGLCRHCPLSQMGTPSTSCPPSPKPKLSCCFFLPVKMEKVFLTTALEQSVVNIPAWASVSGP